MIGTVLSFGTLFAENRHRLIINPLNRHRTQYYSGRLLQSKNTVQVSFSRCRSKTRLIPCNSTSHQKDTKGTWVFQTISKELGLIFRANGDCDEVRQLPTPDWKVVIENLHSFRERWKSFLNMEEMKKARLELHHLSEHIKKSCLSG